jgi:hypothetical protein
MGFSIRNFAYHALAQFQIGWVFHVNGKQPQTQAEGERLKIDVDNF